MRSSPLIKRWKNSKSSVYRSDQFVQKLIAAAGAAPIGGYVLSVTDAANLSQLLLVDATDSYYSAAVSLGDGLSGTERRFFSWATVKLYYSAFYSLQSVLAASGHCLFHLGKKPKWIRAVAGSSPTNASGTTHGTILKFFEKLYISHLLLSQPIGNDPPLQWIMDRRVEANYGTPGSTSQACQIILPQFPKSGFGRRLRPTNRINRTCTSSIPIMR
jgi:hypothetical protein